MRAATRPTPVERADAARALPPSGDGALATAEVIIRYSNFAVPLLRPSVERDTEAEPVGLSTQAAGQGLAQLSEDDGEAPTLWRLTDAQKALVRQTFLEGSSVRSAARAGGIAYSTAQLLLRPEIEASGRQLVTWRQMTAAEVDEARELRAQGWSYAKLAQQYGVSRQAVTKRLKARPDPGS